MLENMHSYVGEWRRTTTEESTKSVLFYWISHRYIISLKYISVRQEFKYISKNNFLSYQYKLKKFLTKFIL